MINKHIVDQMVKDHAVRSAITRQSHLMFFHFYFAHYVTYATAPFQKEIFDFTESEDTKMLAIVAFRSSGKSTIITTSLPIWAVLGKLQKKFVLIVCQTRVQAKQHMMNMRQELESNELLKNDLGPFKEEEGEWGSSSLVFSNLKARITVASSEQSIRGLRHHQHRPDLIIGDDVEDLSSTKTQEGRDKTYQWFTGDVLPLGDTHTQIILVGNLLHEDSLLMRIKSDIKAERRKGVFCSYPLLDAEGVALWPGKYPDKESIEEQKKVIGSESAWQREYLLRIITDDDQVVRPEWIQYYDMLPPDSTFSNFRFTATGIDLAISEKDTADYTAMVSAKIFGQGQSLRVYILPHPVNERLDFPKTVERVKNLSRALGGGIYTKLYIEDVGYQKALIEHLRSQSIPAEEFKTQGQDKRVRLTLTTNLIQSGKILFPRESADLLIRQLIGFGKERHDDLTDAFSALILKIMSTDTAPFFSEFSLQCHVVEQYTIPPTWPLFRSIVPSTRDRSTSCHWCALDTKGVVHVYKEYYKTGLGADQHAENIRKLSETDEDVSEKYFYTVMANEAFGRPGPAETIWEIYQRHGVDVTLHSGKEQMASWESVFRHLEVKKGFSKLKVFKKNKYLIHQLQSVVRDANDSTNIEMSGEVAAVCGLRNLLQILRDQKASHAETPVQKKMRELFGSTGDDDSD